MNINEWSSDKLLSRLLKNKTRKAYWTYIHELQKRPSKEVFDIGVKLAKSNIDKEKIIGVDVLAQLGIDQRYNQQKVIDLYFEILKSPQTPKVLGAILSGIGHNNSILKDQHFSKLAEFKNHSYSDVRFSLVMSLSGIEDESAIDLLIELSTDSHPDVRDWATFSIGSQVEMNTPSIISALKARLDDSDYDTRVEAISGLAQRKEDSIREILINGLQNIDDQGSFILESIEVFGDQSFIPLIESQIERNKITKTVNEEWLIDCIETLQNSGNVARKTN